MCNQLVQTRYIGYPKSLRVVFTFLSCDSLKLPKTFGTPCVSSKIYKVFFSLYWLKTALRLLGYVVYSIYCRYSIDYLAPVLTGIRKGLL